MGRLRDDRVVAAIGEEQRAARVAEVQRHARIGERVAPARSRTARLAATTSGSSSITSIDSTVLGTAATRHARAEPDDQHVRGVGPHEHRQEREPVRGGGLGRIARRAG